MEDKKVRLNRWQNIIWSDTQKDREKSIHNMGGYLCLDENIDEKKLKKCAYMAISTNDALRMQIDENDEFYIPEYVSEQLEESDDISEQAEDVTEETETEEVVSEYSVEQEEVESEEAESEEADSEEVSEQEETETEEAESEEVAEQEETETEEAESEEVAEQEETETEETESEEVEDEKVDTLEFGSQEKFFNDMTQKLGENFIKPHSPLIKTWFAKTVGQRFLCIAAHGLIVDEHSIKQIFAEIMKMYNMEDEEMAKYIENKRLDEDNASEEVQSVEEEIDEEQIKILCAGSTFCEKVGELSEKTWILKEEVESTESAEYIWHIKYDVFNDIKTYEGNHEIPAENLFMGALATFVNQVTGSDNVVVLKRLVNREEEELETYGRFAHELPLVLPINEDNTFQEVCENIAYENGKLEEIRKCKLDDLLEYSGWQGQLADIAIAFEKEELLDDICMGGVNEAFCDYKQIPLTIHVCEKKDRFTVRMQYQKEAYKEYQIESLSLALDHILRNSCKHTTVVRDIALGEKSNLSKVSGGFEAREEFLLTVIEAFFESVDKNPYETAFIYEEDGEIKKMDYKIAGDCVCAVASYLMRNGVERGDIVGIHMKRGVLMPLTMLASLLLETTILPIDIDGRENFNKKYYDMCKFVVEDEFCSGEGKEILAAKGQLDNVEEQSLYHGPKDIAYYVKKVCSSSEEKLVAISNNSLAVRFNWHSKIFGTKGIFMQKTKNIYDTAMLELLYPCYVGATLYILPDGKEFDMDYVAKKIEEESVTHIHFTPTMLEEFIESDNWEKIYSLKYLMLSDEAVNPVSLLTLKENRPNIKVYNLYGPVECTIDVTAYECDGTEENVPLGNVADRSYIYIVNKDTKLVPKGYKGEILIAGALLGEGYYGSEEEEEESDFFIRKNTRYYRTGDFGWVDDNGVLYYAGRKDSDIKVSGIKLYNTFLENKALESRLITHAMADFEDGKWVLYYQKKKASLRRRKKVADVENETDIITEEYIDDVADKTEAVNESGNDNLTVEVQVEVEAKSDESEATTVTDDSSDEASTSNEADTDTETDTETDAGYTSSYSSGYGVGYTSSYSSGYGVGYASDNSSGYGTSYGVGYASDYSSDAEQSTEYTDGFTSGFSASDWFKTDTSGETETKVEEIAVENTETQEERTSLNEDNAQTPGTDEETSADSDDNVAEAIEAEQKATEEDVEEDVVVGIEEYDEEYYEEDDVDVQEKLMSFLEQELPDYYWPSEYCEIEQFPIADNGKLDRKKLVRDRWEMLREAAELEARMLAMENEKNQTEEEEELISEVEPEVEPEIEPEVETEAEVEVANTDTGVQTYEQGILYFKREGVKKLLIAVPYVGGKDENMKALIGLYENSDIAVCDIPAIAKETGGKITDMYQHIYEYVLQKIDPVEFEVAVLGYCVGTAFAMGIYEYIQERNVNVGDLIFCGSLPVFSFDKQGETATLWDYTPNGVLSTVQKLLGMDKKLSVEAAELFKKEAKMAANLLNNRSKRVQVAKGHRLILIYGSKDKLTLSWNKKYKQWAQYVSAKVFVKCIDNRGHYELLDYKRD